MRDVKVVGQGKFWKYVEASCVAIVCVFLNRKKLYETIRDDCEPIYIKRRAAEWIFAFHNLYAISRFFPTLITVFQNFKCSVDSFFELVVLPSWMLHLNVNSTFEENSNVSVKKFGIVFSSEVEKII